jgi:hypothetical protein
MGKGTDACHHFIEVVRFMKEGKLPTEFVSGLLPLNLGNLLMEKP